jgi:hypothetical protein
MNRKQHPMKKTLELKQVLIDEMELGKMYYIDDYNSGAWSDVHRIGKLVEKEKSKFDDNMRYRFDVVWENKKDFFPHFSVSETSENLYNFYEIDKEANPEYYV